VRVYRVHVKLPYLYVLVCGMKIQNDRNHTLIFTYDTMGIYMQSFLSETKQRDCPIQIRSTNQAQGIL
jgi:hypothetical protein